MDLYQLKIFFVFCKVLSFTETAEIMCLTQSAVSHAIKKLEGSINSTLILRKGKSCKLSVEGKELQKACEVVFFELERVEDKLNNLKGINIEKVTIGSPVEFGTTMLIKYLSNFIKKSEKISLNFLFSHNLEKPFFQDKVDFIIDCKTHEFTNTKKIPLFLEQYSVIASPYYVNTKKINKLEDLVKATILSIDEDGKWWQNFKNVLPENIEFAYKNIMQINHVRGIINGAIEGLGIGFVPSYTVTSELNNNLLLNPFKNIQPEVDKFCIYVKNEKLKFPKNKILINYLSKLNFNDF